MRTARSGTFFRLEDSERRQVEIERGNSVVNGSVTPFNSVPHDAVTEFRRAERQAHGEEEGHGAHKFRCEALLDAVEVGQEVYDRATAWCECLENSAHEQVAAREGRGIGRASSATRRLY